MISFRSRTALLAALSAFAIGLPAIAQEAASPEDHGRRAEVNKRISGQNKRINEAVRTGKMSREEAKQLHQEHAQIRQEEKAMAQQHGGHITAEEQKALNKQENSINRQIAH